MDSRVMQWDVDRTVEHLITVWDLYRFAKSRLAEADLCFRSGMGSASAEAAFLISHCLSLDAEEMELFAKARLLPKERARILEFLSQRIESAKPMAYVIQATWYCGHQLYIDERALIPRSAIGTMLEDYFQSFDPQQDYRILDMGTGSGSIAVAYAYAFPNANIVAAEKFTDALAVADINVRRHGLQDRVTTLESDSFQALKGQSFDWILCNPPYVSEDFKQVMSKEYSFEPEEALFGGSDGLTFIRRFLADSANHLTEGGLLAMEMGDITGERFREMFPRAGGEWYCHPESGNPVVFVLNYEQLQALLPALQK